MVTTTMRVVCSRPFRKRRLGLEEKQIIVGDSRCVGTRRTFTAFADDDGTSSSNDVKDDVGIQTNDGIIEGVWVFVRHGDRAPSRPLSPNHKIAAEADFWRSKLPRPDSLAAFQGFSQHFPPCIHPGTNDGEFLDVRRAPFGFLTHTGVKQTNELGARLFRRYTNHGFVQNHNIDDIASPQAENFLKTWDVKVYSTNYLRTVMSAQSLMDGLLGTNCYDMLQERLRRNREIDSLHEDYFLGEFRIPNHSSVASPRHDNVDDNNGPPNEALVKVQVRGPKSDTLNAFDRSPELMAELVLNVISSPDFQEGDGAAAPLAARLANILPGLARKKADNSGFNAAPSGISWIEATDHFVCRSAHEVPFSRFSDFEHDERLEFVLTAMAHKTTAHLAWRFRQWYKNPTLLAHIAAPALREVCDQLMAAITLEAGERHPFNIYACHDVTILGLLYGISADLLAGDDLGGWRFWPQYASTLIFELVRIKRSNGKDAHVVRILLNGKPVKSVTKDNGCFWEGSCQYIGNGPHRMLNPKDFDHVIQNLEMAGGQNSYMTCEDDPSTKIDISNVTG